MTETLSTITRHYLCTQVVQLGATYALRIRTAFNWADYWMDSYAIRDMDKADQRVTTRMVELNNNVPIAIVIDGIRYEVVKRA